MVIVSVAKGDGRGLVCFLKEVGEVEMHAQIWVFGCIGESWLPLQSAHLDLETPIAWWLPNLKHRALRQSTLMSKSIALNLLILKPWPV